MSNSQVYLDHNASAPLLAEARTSMIQAMALTGNPSSVHRHGRTLSNIVEGARRSVASISGAQPEQIVFTGSATEAITQAIVGGVHAFNFDRVIVSGGEHSAVSAAAKLTEARVETAKMLASGLIDIADLKKRLQQADIAGHRVLVAVQMVNNETGVIQPLAEVEALVGDREHMLLVDAVQGLAKLPMTFDFDACDMMAISAHKIGGPAGVGALLVKNHCDPVRIIPGGGQERGRRGGTQSAILMAGFGAAAKTYSARFDLQRAAELIDFLEERLLALCPDLVIFGKDAPRIGSVSNFALPGLKNSALMMGLDLAGISVSSGSACASGKTSRSHVLAAMGIDDELADCAIRISVGWNTQQHEIELAVAEISRIYHRQKTQGKTAAQNGKAA